MSSSPCLISSTDLLGLELPNSRGMTRTVLYLIDSRPVLSYTLAWISSMSIESTRTGSKLSLGLISSSCLFVGIKSCPKHSNHRAHMFLHCWRSVSRFARILSQSYASELLLLGWSDC